MGLCSCYFIFRFAAKIFSSISSFGKYHHGHTIMPGGYVQYNEQTYRPLMPEGRITHFDDVPINQGNCFDPVLGEFKVPRNGVFVFEINLKGCFARVLIKVNDKNYDIFEFGANYGPDDTYLYVIKTIKVPLKEGDSITFHNNKSPCEWKQPFNANHFVVIGTIYY